MITIEKDVPLIRPEPPDTSLPPDWPMDALEVGDSFVTGPINMLDMAWHARNWGTSTSPLVRKSFRYQEIEKEGRNANYRIWRTK